MIRVLIIDDEEPARKKIASLLTAYQDLTVSGEAKNGTEAVQLINTIHPDLIFLDIQMPGLNGFEVLREIKNPPFIIFTTAYDQFALNAFEVNAIDYLLKPFDEERFGKAMSQALDRIALKEKSRFEKQLMKLVHDYQHQRGEETDVISYKDRGRHIHVPVFDIQVVEASGNYLKLHTKTAQHLVRSTMAEIEERLPGDRFLRIHRSYFVNKDFVDRCVYRKNNEYIFTMNNGKKLQSGRKFKEMIEMRMF